MAERPKHRYALEELLDEAPPGWSKYILDDGSIRYSSIDRRTAEHYAALQGPAFQTYLGQCRPFSTQHAWMAAIDDWLEQQGLLDG